MLLGLVGPPNVGKSTFLAASTGATVQIANYPFTTIDPNRGIGFATGKCPHPDFGLPHCNARGGCDNGIRKIPVNLMDVAGLVPEAHLGKGKGIEFLGDLAAADGLLLVVDASGSTDTQGNSKEPGTQSAVAQAYFIDAELTHWIASILKRNADKAKGKKFAEFAQALTGLKVTETMLRDAIAETQIGENYLKWTDGELFRLATILRQRAKPILIVANKCDSPHAKKNVEELRKAYPRYFVIPCSADSELALKRAKEKSWIEYDGNDFTIKSNVPEAAKQALHKIRDSVFREWNGTGVQKAINTAVFEMLRYIAIYPGAPEYNLKEDEGKILLDVFLLEPGSTAIEFAGKIHSDFAKNFIRAIDCRTKRSIGKDHVLKDGDVINIVAGR